METDIKDLELFLKRETIPLLRKRPTTFLGISKQPHYENVWSNIYAFFFNISSEHKLEDLFFKSLVQLIKRKTKTEFSFRTDFNIDTEFGTEKNGRIDLLLSNQDEAIIIENKVYHHLNNDLHDYWNSVKQEKKQGVILSLREISSNTITNKNFINITHLEFMQCVMENLAQYFSNADEKYLVFLKDFYQNIINTTNPMDKNIIKFYCQNEQKIRQLKEIRDSYVNYIVSEVEKAREYIDEKLEPYSNRNDSYRYYLCPNEGNLMITVAFVELFDTRRKLYLIIELQNNLLGLESKEKIRAINFEDTEKKFLKPDFYDQKSSWAHFAVQTCELTEEDIMNLGTYISDTINKSPILDIYRKLRIALVDNK